MPYPPWSTAGHEPEPGARRRRSWRGRIVATVLGVLVQLPGLAFAFASAWHGVERTPDVVAGLASLSGIVAALLLLLPWRGPGVILVAAFAMPAIALAAGPPLAALPVAFAVGRAVLGGAAVWAWSTLAGVGVTAVVWAAVSGSVASGVRLLGVTVVLCLVAAAVTGAAIRRARFRAAARYETSRRRSAAEEERLRIARELHDVLAHSLSQISVQAGVGLHLFDDDPERAKESLRSIRDTSASALDEVRGVLGMLRDSDEGAAPRHPEPTLQELPALLAEVRAAGTDVTAAGNATTGTQPPADAAPQAVQSAAYRIVQEALTNVRRHAPGTPVTVDVNASADAVRIRVENGPPGAAQGAGRPPAGRLPGMGILGMRERARALGGSLEAAPTPDGGFIVRAELPVVRSRT
jgi:signal transduction histidine kinase